MRRLNALVLAGAGLMMAGGCSASEPSPPAPTGGAAAVCGVDGDTKLLPSITKAAICQRFMSALDAELHQATAPRSRDGWQFRLSVSPPGVATAILSHRDASHAIDVNIAVSDRPLDGYVIDSLGAAVARRLIAESEHWRARRPLSPAT